MGELASKENKEGNCVSFSYYVKARGTTESNNGWTEVEKINENFHVFKHFLYFFELQIEYNFL